MHLVRSKRPLCWWCGVVWRGGRWLLADARGARAAAAAHLKIRSDVSVSDGRRPSTIESDESNGGPWRPPADQAQAAAESGQPQPSLASHCCCCPSDTILRSCILLAASVSCLLAHIASRQRLEGVHPQGVKTPRASPPPLTQPLCHLSRSGTNPRPPSLLPPRPRPRCRRPLRPPCIFSQLPPPQRRPPRPRPRLHPRPPRRRPRRTTHLRPPHRPPRRPPSMRALRLLWRSPAAGRRHDRSYRRSHRQPQRPCPRRPCTRCACR